MEKRNRLRPEKSLDRKIIAAQKRYTQQINVKVSPNTHARMLREAKIREIKPSVLLRLLLEDRYDT
jgi:hypothetical protein